MNMRIRTWLGTTDPQTGKRLEFEREPCSYHNAGYASVAEMRKELRRRWNAVATLTDIADGLRIVWKQRDEKQEVTLT